ncbi:hypothetical protein ACB092_05G090900 [Castanea dentata]
MFGIRVIINFDFSVFHYSFPQAAIFCSYLTQPQPLSGSLQNLFKISHKHRSLQSYSNPHTAPVSLQVSLKFQCLCNLRLGFANNYGFKRCWHR